MYVWSHSPGMHVGMCEFVDAIKQTNDSRKNGKKMRTNEIASVFVGFNLLPFK